MPQWANNSCQGEKPWRERLSMDADIINSLIIVKTLLYKIPPNLPLPKGVPRYAGFEKEGRGEIF